MNFASFAPLVSSSASPALLPLQSLFRFFFASSATPQPILPNKRPCNRTACQPAFLKPDLKPGLKTSHKPSHKPSLESSLKPNIVQRLPDNRAAAGPHQNTSTISAPRHQKPTLRVVRMFESGQSPKAVGRMVICGRMADVCAELDRLVGREQAIRDGVIH